MSIWLLNCIVLLCLLLAAGPQIPLSPVSISDAHLLLCLNIPAKVLIAKGPIETSDYFVCLLPLLDYVTETGVITMYLFRTERCRIKARKQVFSAYD